MKAILRLSFAAAVFSLAGLAGCGSKQQPSEPPSTEIQVANPNAKPVDPAVAGSASGTVRLDGVAPKMKTISMAAVPNCSKLRSSPAATEDVVTDDNNALQNVVVYLKGDFSQYSFPKRDEQVVVDQKGCVYSPHVAAVMTGEAVRFTNSDQTTHNIHPLPAKNREWNESQSPRSEPIMKSFAREEIAIRIKCNIHIWMKSYIAVIGNPYFQVTGNDGSFTLQNIPPGTYTLTAWHEMYGTSEQTIRIESGKNQTAMITFKTAHQ